MNQILYNVRHETLPFIDFLFSDSSEIILGETTAAAGLPPPPRMPLIMWPCPARIGLAINLFIFLESY